MMFEIGDYIIDDKKIYVILFAWYTLDIRIRNEILELTKTRFNYNPKYHGYENKEDAQKCANYLNEVYLLAIKLMGDE